MQKSLIDKLRDKVVHIWFRLSRSMTIGVRIAAFDNDGRIFLVRHTYVKGWHLPGGGIERGEAAMDAVHKELQEEGNLIVKDTPKLLAVYFNTHMTNRDHVIFYQCTVMQSEPKKPDREIAEAGFFDLAALPNGTTKATLRRIAELVSDKGYADNW